MTALSGVTASVSLRAGLKTDKFLKVSAVLTFGDGALTYPSGGIPVTAAQLGFRNAIRDILFVDASGGDGYLYKYDLTNNKVRIYQGNYTASAVGPLVELGAVAVAATTLKIEAEGF